MAARWIDTTIGEQVTLQRGIDITKAEQRAGPIPVISSGGVTSYHDERAATGPGVVLGRKGVVGSVYFVTTDYWPHDTTLWVKDFHGNDPRFVYYFFRSFARQLAMMDVGSANPTLNRNHVHPIRVCWPPLSEQRAIASILGALDDKIELNRRMNETLEAIARAIFKSWFIDFDPVRAKVEGREPYGMDAETAALFPDRFEESRLGLIPEGWEIASLGMLVDVIDCLHSKKPDRQTGGAPLLQLQNIRDDGLIDLTDIFYISEADYKQWTFRMEAQAGDCVVTNVGRVGAVGQIPEGIRAALGRNMTGLKIRVTFPYPTFIIEALRSESVKAEIALKTDSGTILDSLNVRSIPTLRVMRPTPGILERFESRCRPIRSRMEHLLIEIRVLASLRDALLPKLLSGEIRVSQSESR